MRQHIVILAKRYFGCDSIYKMILSGAKTIESRWSMNKIAPYGKVSVGDILLLKESGKPITAKAVVKDVKYYRLTPEIVDEIRVKYGKQIGTDGKADWADTMQKRYGTLIWLSDVHTVEPIYIQKSHGAGWIVVD